MHDASPLCVSVSAAERFMFDLLMFIRRILSFCNASIQINFINPREVIQN